MIDRHHELSISKQAKALKISRGSVYYLPRPVSAANLAVMRRMDELHLESPFAGSLQWQSAEIIRCLLGSLARAVCFHPA